MKDFWARRKYSKEDFVDAWNSSSSYREVFRKLNLHSGSEARKSVDAAAKECELSNKHLNLRRSQMPVIKGKIFCNNHKDYHPESDFVAGAQVRCKAALADWRQDNRERIKKARERYIESHKDEQTHVARLRKYGLSKENYEKLLTARGGGCYICGSSSELVVDHDHSCCAGQYTCGACVRGILCQSCNRGLGHFKDNLDLLYKAASYLERG